MIFFLLYISCGDVPDSKANAKEPVVNKLSKKEKRENRKKAKEEKYKVVLEDLKNTKQDMRCIKEYITVQQQTPEQKINYDLFEEDNCKKEKFSY